MVSLSKWKYLVNSRTLRKLGGGSLKERGLISNFDSEGSGLIQRGGLHRAFMVSFSKVKRS